MSSPIRNILLDRDGTLIVDKHYQCDPDALELLPGAVEGLRALSMAGMRLFVLTNQSGIGRGYFSEAQFAACTERLDAMLRGYGIVVQATVHCPHAPAEGEGECDCRKPATGMWRDLQARYGLLPEESVMVGDKMADVLMGMRAGLAASVLVRTGKGENVAQSLGLSASPANGWFVPNTRSGVLPGKPGQRNHAGQSGALEQAGREVVPHCVARDLAAVADWILKGGTAGSRAGQHSGAEAHDQQVAAEVKEQ